MNSFISVLTQTERPAPLQRKASPRVDEVRPFKLHARDAVRADKYLTIIGTDCLSTATIAAEVGMPPSNVNKHLKRLANRGFIFRAGTNGDKCGRPAVLWRAVGGVDAVRVHTTVYVAAIGAGDQKDTGRIAKVVGIDYYTALAHLKRLETEGLVRRVGVNRSVENSPSIIWEAI